MKESGGLEAKMFGEKGAPFPHHSMLENKDKDGDEYEKSILDTLGGMEGGLRQNAQQDKKVTENNKKIADTKKSIWNLFGKK